MTKQAKAQIARDLYVQAIDKQRRMQQEREQDVEYSKRIKQECVEFDRKKHRHNKSEVDKHLKNQHELLKQVRCESAKRQSEKVEEKAIEHQ